MNSSSKCFLDLSIVDVGQCLNNHPDEVGVGYSRLKTGILFRELVEEFSSFCDNVQVLMREQLHYIR